MFNISVPQCESFVIGDESKKSLYSPGYPKDYPNKTECVARLVGKYIYVGNVFYCG